MRERAAKVWLLKISKIRKTWFRWIANLSVNSQESLCDLTLQSNLLMQVEICET